MRFRKQFPLRFPSSASSSPEHRQHSGPQRPATCWSSPPTQLRPQPRLRHGFRSTLGLRALEKACPLLVPLVEEGWTASDPFALLASQANAAQAGPFPSQMTTQMAPQVAVTAEVLRIYLDELNAEASSLGMNPDTLVLRDAPTIRCSSRSFRRRFPDGVRAIDSAESAADKLMMYLSHDQPAPTPADGDTVLRCFATDSVEKFERLGSRFLGRPTGPVELVDLGGSNGGQVVEAEFTLTSTRYSAEGSLPSPSQLAN